MFCYTVFVCSDPLQLTDTIRNKFLDFNPQTNSTRFKVHLMIVSGIDSPAKEATGKIGSYTPSLFSYNIHRRFACASSSLLPDYAVERS